MKKQKKIRKFSLGLLTASILLGGHLATAMPSTHFAAETVGSEEKEKSSSSSQTETTEESQVKSEETTETKETKDTKELPPLKDLSRLLMPNGRANATTLDTRQAELFADGWTTRVDSKNAAFEIPIPNDPLNGRLSYFFGSPAMKNASLPLNKDYRWANLRIPNVEYIFKGSKGTDITATHLWQQNTGGTDDNAAYTQNKTTQGLIVATDSVSKYSVMSLEPSLVRMYEKTQAGFTSIKMVYDAKYFSTAYNPSLLVETTMTPLASGKIMISQQVTNKDTVPQENFMLGYSEDALLGGEDHVPIHYVGDNRGVYIKSTGVSAAVEKQVLKLTYLMSPTDLGTQAPKNWAGRAWTDFNSDGSAFNKGEKFFNALYTTFSAPNSTGQEINNGVKDEIVNPGKWDAAIHMKNQPITLGVGESTGFSWTLGMDGIMKGPVVTLDKDSEVIEPDFGTYNVKGTWSDSDDPQTEIFYSVNGGSFTSLGKKANSNIGTDVDFQIPLTSAQLNVGENTVEVKLKNSAGKESPIRSMTIKVKSKIDIKYVNASNVAITPPAGSPTSLTGVVGDEFSFSIPTINKYTFSTNSSNVTKSGNNLFGQYTKENQTVTLTYKLTQTNGVVNFTYKDSKGNIIVPPAGVNAPTTATGVIGDTIRFDTPDMTPKYEVASIAGDATVAGDKKQFWVKYKEDVIDIVITYDIKGKANIKYVDEARNPITPPTGSPTELWGALATPKREAVPSLLPLYEISSVEGATLSSDKSSYLLSGFTEADQTVTLVYKTIPQEVKMTVKYVMDQTNNDVIDLATNQAVKDVVETVTIGELISGYSNPHKLDIDGYTYKSVTGNIGNVLDKDFVVTYYYEGKLGLENVPKEVDFGQDTRLISFGKQKIYPTTPIEVGILDTRDSSSQSWQLQLKISDPIKTPSNQLLKGSLKFNQGGNDIALTDAGQVIKTQGAKVLGRENLTWSSTGDKGLFLEQEPGNLKDVAYKGTVSWQLTDGL